MQYSGGMRIPRPGNFSDPGFIVTLSTFFPHPGYQDQSFWKVSEKPFAWFRNKVITHGQKFWNSKASVNPVLYNKELRHRALTASTCAVHKVCDTLYWGMRSLGFKNSRTSRSISSHFTFFPTLGTEMKVCAKLQRNRSHGNRDEIIAPDEVLVSF